MDKRYSALRIIGTVYKIFGVIVLALTIIAAIASCAFSVLGGVALNDFSRSFGADSGPFGLISGIFGAIIVPLFTIIWGGGAGLTLYAMGEGIFLLLAMEENTRETAELLRSR